MKQFLKLILSAALVFLSVALVHGQDDLIIQGAVKDKDSMKKMEQVTVTVYKGGSVFDTFTTSSSGKYKFELPLGSDYNIKFSSADYLAKSVQLDTRNIPEEDRAGGFIMDMDMTLFHTIEGFDESILAKPIGKAGFDPIKNSIEFDFDYTARINQEIEAELERLAGLEEEMEKLRKEFDELIAKGDQKMTQAKYADAVAKYEEALRLIPSDEPGQKKLAEAQAKLDEQNALAEKEAEYLRHMDEGEKHAKNKSYQDAIDSFEAALNIKPGEKLPKDRIKAMQDALAADADNQQYTKLIDEADKYFKNEDYALSIEKYEAASGIKPGEKYPREQKLEAQRLLDAMLSAELAEAERKKKYDELIALGSKNMKSENYQDARRNYVEAGDLFPDERLPKDKIKEIDDILDSLAANDEANRLKAQEDEERARLDKEYQALIDSANDKFDGEQLAEARADYVAASELKPNEKYPKGRITRIDELLAKADESEQQAKDDELAQKLREQEEQAAAEKAERERLAEEERQRRIEEELAEQRRLAEERERDEEAEKERRARMMNNVDTSREDEVEKYYRDARLSEEAAKANRIQQEKEDHMAYLANKDQSAESTRKNNEQGLDELETSMTAIYRDGEYRQKEKQGDIDTIKERDQQHSEDWISGSAYSRNQNKEEADQLGETQAALTANDVHRLAHEDRIDRKKKDIQSSQESYMKRGDALRTDKEYDVNREKEGSYQTAFRGEEVRLENVDEAVDRKEAVTEAEKDVISASEDRRASSIDRTEEAKEELSAIGEGKESLTEDRMYQINKAKNDNQEFLAQAEQNAENARYDKRKDLFDKDSGSPKHVDDFILPEGAEDVPEGVSENSYQLGNKIVMERTVKIGNKVDHYRKVVSKSGTYYFKNDKAITATTWKQETINVGD